MKNAFTLVEILVVVTIISLLASIAAVSYSSSVKQSRDARRKTDLEQIRSGLEMYKSFNNAYPTPQASPLPLGSILNDTTTTYVGKVPTDPTASYAYYYAQPVSSQDYILCSHLEAGGTNAAGHACGASSCNYCLGPYGERTD